MLGLPTPHRLSLVLGRPASARRGFARFAGAHGPFDSVRCWSPRLADLVVDSGLGHQRFFPLPASSDPDEASRVARLFPARVRAPHRPWTIALLNDPPTLVNALNAVHAGGLLEKSGHRCTIVVDQAATHWIQACRLARDIRLKLDLVRSACVIAELHRFDAVGMIGTRATPEASFLADVIRAVGVPLVTAPSPMLVARALLPLASLALSGVPA